MKDEDVKELVARGEITAFIIGNIFGGICSLMHEIKTLDAISDIRYIEMQLGKIQSYLQVQIEKLYYPVNYD